MKIRVLLFVILLATMAHTMSGIGRCGRGMPDEVPDMTGTWALSIDGTFDVDIDIGGAVYNGSLGAAGGVVTVEHDDEDLEFEVDCAADAIVCPNEVFPEEVDVTHRAAPDRFDITIFEQTCQGDTVDPDPSECGEDTVNPDCEPVCDGTLITRQSSRAGWIVETETGMGIEVLLGGGFTSGGSSCALASWSIAEADLITEGAAEDGDWVATEWTDGLVTAIYSGGCLWAENVDLDPDVEASVINATVTITSGFTATIL